MELDTDKRSHSLHSLLPTCWMEEQLSLRESGPILPKKPCLVPGSKPKSTSEPGFMVEMPAGVQDGGCNTRMGFPCRLP